MDIPEFSYEPKDKSPASLSCHTLKELELSRTLDIIGRDRDFLAPRLSTPSFTDR